MATKTNLSPLSRKVETHADVLDAVISQLDADSVAAADQLLADSDAASMRPEGLVGSEIADYDEACEIAAPFLARTLKNQMAMPVAAGLEELGAGTLAEFVAKTLSYPIIPAVQAASARISQFVNQSGKFGDNTVYLHRRAQIIQSAEPDDLTSPRLYIIELPEGSPLRTTVIGSDNKRTTYTHAEVVLFPSKTYDLPDRKTGEMKPQVDTGRYNPDVIWAGHGGIVRFLDDDQQRGICLDWMFDREVHNTAWALATLRRLARIAKIRNARGARTETESDPYDQPF